MKKSLLAPAVGACLALSAAAASAQSQVTIYGITAIEAIHVTNVVTAGPRAPAR